MHLIKCRGSSSQRVNPPVPPRPRLFSPYVGVPHPRTYGTFARKIRLYVKEKGTVTLEHAIRSMTSLPAQVFGMPNRGTLRAGAAADVVVFDIEAVRDMAEYIDPHHYSEGMVHVFVNGEAAIRDGEFTGECPGRVPQKGR